VIGERGDDGAHEADKAIGTSRGGNVHDQHQARTIKPCLNPVDRECPLIRRIVVVHAAHTAAFATARSGGTGAGLCISTGCRTFKLIVSVLCWR